MSVGERLRSARERLGLTQAELAAAAGVDRKSQGLFERDAHKPGGSYLLAIAAVGVDIAYVLTGQAGARDAIESELLLRYRAASQEVRGAVLRILDVPAAGDSPAAVSITGGEQGQVVAGNVEQRGVTFNVGGKKKGTRK